MKRGFRAGNLEGPHLRIKKNPENLSNKQGPRLSELEGPHLSINLAYLLKESFRPLRDYTYRARA